MKMKSEKRMVLIVIIGTIFLFGTAGIGFAASSTIDLEYEAAGIEEARCSKSVAVITFEDKRDKKVIGESGKGKKFYGKNPVNEWVTRALYDELKRTGCKAEYHDKDGNYNTDFTITGVVEKAFIKQKSMTKYQVTMRIYLNINQGGEKVLGKSYVSNLTKTTVPSFSFNNKVATETLQGMMREVVPELHKQLK